MEGKTFTREDQTEMLKSSIRLREAKNQTLDVDIAVAIPDESLNEIMQSPL